MGDSGDRAKARYGTELEEMEDERAGVRRRPLRPEEQVVTDDRGRRRFHGAFTGGFSAGHFMTVGTREGWVPSAFKSSRSERPDPDDVAERRPEDFMDDEDLGQFGIAPRTLQTRKDFANEPTSSLAWERQPSAQSSSAPKAPKALESLVRPVPSSFGAKLLISMGWRAGKGIGAKQKKKLRQEQGCELPPELAQQLEAEEVDSDSDSSLDIDLDAEILLDPEDVDPHVFQAKKDLHGIGYSPLTSGHLGTATAAKPKGVQIGAKGRKGVMRGQAFGVGAFEEEDEDIYSLTSMESYDLAIGETAGDQAAQSSLDKHKSFKAAKDPLPARPFFHKPKLPRDFQPVHRPLPFAADDSLRTLARDEKMKMNPLLRARLLGESYSISALVPSRKRRLSEEEPKRPATPPKSIKREPTEEERERRHTAESRRNTLVFPRDPERQGRWTQWLNCARRGWTMPQPPELTETEWAAEQREFRRLIPEHIRREMEEEEEQKDGKESRPLARADVAAPFAHLLASKFTSASAAANPDAPTPNASSDAQDAVKAKLFGKLTREKFKWHPAFVLCKRFNLPNPYPDSGLEGCPELSARKGVKERNRMDSILGAAELPSTSKELDQRRRLRKSPSPEPVKREAEEPEAPLEEVRPAPDLFAAIFEDGEDEPEPEPPAPSQATPFPGPSLPSPAFAQAPPPAPSRVHVPPPPPSREPKREPPSSTRSQPRPPSPDSYGPALPPGTGSPARLRSPKNSPLSSPTHRDSAKKAKKHRKEKKQRKEKKKKAKEKKAKHSKRRRKEERRSPSRDSDTSSDSDVQIIK